MGGTARRKPPSPLTLHTDLLAGCRENNPAPVLTKARTRKTIVLHPKTYLVEGEINDFAYGLQQSRSGAGCCRVGSHARSVSVNPFSLLSPRCSGLPSAAVTIKNAASNAAAAVVATGWTLVIRCTHPTEKTEPRQEHYRPCTFLFVSHPWEGGTDRFFDD